MSAEFIKSNPSKFKRNYIFSYLRGIPPSIPIKFQYIGTGAQRWEELTRSQKYITQYETELLENVKSAIVSVLSQRISGKLTNYNSVRVVDIGCGTGEKGGILIRELNKLSLKVKYYPLDFSKEIISKATKTCSNLGIAFTKGEVVDYELEPIAPYVYKERKEHVIDLLLFLGNNLGNIENNYKKQIKEISKSMRNEVDFLLLGVELVPRCSAKKASQRLIKIYSSPAVVRFLSTGLEYFGVLPSELSKTGCGKICASLQNSELHLYFEFAKQRKVSLKGTGDLITFNKGDKIHLAKSGRFNLKELKNSLMEHNLKPIRSWKDEDGSSSYILCQKGGNEH